MKKECIISTIIPIYNAEKYLCNTLDSLLIQNVYEKNREIILIDDGSTDNSGRICDVYSKRYDFIKTYHLKNCGVSSARNFGLYKASGKYIHFMDSDAILYINMYQMFLEICSKYSPDVIVGGVERIDLKKNSKVYLGPSINKNYRGERGISEFLKSLEMDDERWAFDYIWNKFFKRDFILSENITFSKSITIGEDFEFNCKFFSTVKNVFTVASIVYKYFIRNTGLVTAFHTNLWEIRDCLYKAHIRVYSLNNCLTKDKENEIRRYNGKLAFADLRSINNKRCTLNKKEKEMQIIGMINSNQYINILYYLKHDKRIKQRIFWLLLKNKNTQAIQFVIWLDKVYRKFN